MNPLCWLLILSAIATIFAVAAAMLSSKISRRESSEANNDNAQ